jgi:DNA-binding Xre family transcriptional regulator
MSYQNFNRVVMNQTGSIKFETLEQLRMGLGCPIGDLFEVISEDTSEEIRKDT